ncbi:hypothetical protein PR048_020419 [Dryococelus australis]|uniref:RNA-directed DNA polymerase n=1 Tax=Dryococelus australis TaxID=614101 RepID=A0ABQ9H694_9NEOP|nr:hypothetical protein PR048_020419 [Dryococelus australis]
MNGNFKKLCDEPELRKYFQIYKQLSTQEGFLMYGNRVVIPGQLKNKILSIIHADHVGITRCKLMARSHVWWFGMNDNIEKKVRTLQNRGHKVIKSWPVSKCPWYRNHIDLLGTHKAKFVIVVDDYTKWIECFNLNNINLGNIMASLSEMFFKILST